MHHIATLRRVFVIYQTLSALVPEVRTLVDQKPGVPDKRG